MEVHVESNAKSRVPEADQSHPFKNVRGDVLSGLTVALVGLPQCLAYAMLSGLPPAYGIATAAVPGLVAALAGRSAQVVTGPTNTTGLLVLSALFPFLGANGLIGPESLPALATLTLLAGALRILLGLAGGAVLLRFIPESVLVGFTAGAGILIAAMQLDEALGLPPVRGTGLVSQVEGLSEYFRDGIFPAPGAVSLTVGLVVALAWGRKRLPQLPVALLALGVVSAAAWAWGWDASHGVPLVSDRASVPNGWPPIARPDLSLSLLQSFLVPALAITLLGSLELAVCARAKGARPDMRREILAQGTANVAGAFTGSFPASASLTRSALLLQGGARTRLAAAYAAVFVVPILLFGAPAVGVIPQAGLAGVLFVTAYGMVDWAAMHRMWRAAPATRALLIVTLSSTLVLPLEWAILVGAGLGLVIHLARTSTPRIRMLKPGLDRERLMPLEASDDAETIVVEVSGDLHYAAVDPFLAEVEHRLPSSAKIVVMDLSHAHEMRFTALSALERFARDLEDGGRELRLSGVAAEVCEMIESSGSRLDVTRAEPEPYKSLQTCLAAIRRRDGEPKETS